MQHRDVHGKDSAAGDEAHGAVLHTHGATQVDMQVAEGERVLKGEGARHSLLNYRA
jgi:hypothetical protein